MVLLYIIRSCCYLYLLCVCALPSVWAQGHRLVLSMTLIVALEACRHNKIGDAFGNLVSLVLPVIEESIVCDGSAGVDILIAGLCLHGVWEPQISTSVLS